MPARRCACALERAQPQPSGATAVAALRRSTLAGQRYFPVCRAHEPRCCQPGRQQPLPVDARQPGAGLLGRFLGCLPAPAWPSGRQRQLVGGGHHLAARCHDAAGLHGLNFLAPKTKALPCSAFFVPSMPWASGHQLLHRLFVFGRRFFDHLSRQTGRRRGLVPLLAVDLGGFQPVA